MDARDAPLFVDILERHVSGLDATHWCEDHLLLDLPSAEDEVWFRLACMDETTLPEMRQFGDRSLLVPPRHQPDVHRWITEGLFEASAHLLTIVRVELRDEDVLRRLETALAAAQQSFTGGGPTLWRD
jgi:hypothetical protein